VAAVQVIPPSVLYAVRLVENAIKRVPVHPTDVGYELELENSDAPLAEVVQFNPFGSVV
jgi:hypothetical protein